MKTIIQSVIAGGLVCLLAGCETTGLSLRENAGVSYPNYILNLPANPAAVVKNIPRPIHLAVAQVGEVAPSQAMLDQLSANSTLIASVTGLPLPGEGMADYRFKSESARDGEYAARVKTICHLAQAGGADYVFIFGGNLDSWEENNVLETFDLTVIGGLLLPGSRIHMEGKGAGSLMEAATGEPVLFVSADAKDSALSPDFLTEGKTADLRVHLRDELTQKLGEALLKQLAQHP